MEDMASRHRAAAPHHTAAQSPPSTTIHRGRVVSVGDRVTSTTYSGRQEDRTTVNTVPEVWIADASGKELRFTDATLAESREGHDVMVFCDRGRGNVVALHNLTTRQTWYAPKLIDCPFNAAHLFSMGLAAMIFCSIAWLIVIGTFGEEWQRRTWWSRTAPDLIYLGALFLAWWAPEKGRRWINRRNAAWRAVIAREVAAATQ